MPTADFDVTSVGAESVVAAMMDPPRPARSPPAPLLKKREVTRTFSCSAMSFERAAAAAVAAAAAAIEIDNDKDGSATTAMMATKMTTIMPTAEEEKTRRLKNLLEEGTDGNAVPVAVADAADQDMESVAAALEIPELVSFSSAFRVGVWH